jgi:hypothetical protein
MRMLSLFLTLRAVSPKGKAGDDASIMVVKNVPLPVFFRKDLLDSMVLIIEY